MPANERLSAEGREIVRVRILAGDTNRQIRQVLTDAGHTPPESDAAYSRYRNDPNVRRAIAERCEHLRQQGLGDRTRRVVKLSAIAERLERRMAPSGSIENLAEADFLFGPNLFMLDRYLQTMQQISKEVGDDKATLEIQTADNSLATLRDFLKGTNGKRTRTGTSEEDMGMDAS